MLSNKENIFLLAVCVATFFFEISRYNGLALLTFLPLTLGVAAVGFWAFPKR